MLWLYRYFKGFLEIIVSGEKNEIIFNIAAENSITLWNSKLIGKNIRTFILIEDFIKLRKLIRRKGIKIHILNRKGFPFKAQKNRKRIGIYLGIVLMFITLQIMSGFIWTIEVIGNKNVTEEEIIKACKTIGIKEGISNKKINQKRDRERLLLICEELSWASLNIEGTKLTVNVTEIKKAENETDSPSNLKSSADGIIKKIDVTVGNCIVKVGDTVTKGDLLVSGIIESESGTVFTKSVGVILAETKTEYEFFAPYTKKIISETGKAKHKKVLEVFGVKIPLYLGEETNAYNSSTEYKNIRLFGEKLPIKIYTKTFNFTETVTINYTKENLYSLLEDELSKKLGNDTDYVLENKEYRETENGIYLKVLVSREENIAVNEEIIKNDYSSE